MMFLQIVMAGFGGQGLLLIGKLLAEACMDEGKEVSWLPSYGPEMRGGTANCTVVVSDDPVASPVINNPDVLIAMNKPSLTKFAPEVKPGGMILINSSLIDFGSNRDDVKEYRIPANDIAQELGNNKAANMVMLGALVGLTHACNLSTLNVWVMHQFKSKAQIIELNDKALRAGMEFVLKQEVNA